ncbi:hypothetical protein ACO0RG_003243 [Hanseniaspora osmophila]|mgnify:CR=1 FL=1|uniref:tRNA pseudouridine synthase 1 n=1 Tax=Hanseniaspora osmophila TaxID=56408 RepID=A0A1E5RDM6_9ASCO|nr:tRNA pseudouridine synthase 1 [Hanseniaspora osmophila]
MSLFTKIGQLAKQLFGKPAPAAETSAKSIGNKRSSSEANLGDANDKSNKKFNNKFNRNNKNNKAKPKKDKYKGKKTPFQGQARVYTPKEGVDPNAPKTPRLPKRKVAVLFGYCGAGYHGLQYNPPSHTIEAELYNAMVKAGAVSEDNAVDPKKSSLQRAARTDKGVHAGGNVISMKLIIEDPDIKDKINACLPEGVRVWNIQRVCNGFDSKNACSSRIYEYLLPTYALLGPNPDTQLYSDLHDKSKNGDLDYKDEESDEFFAKYQQMISENFTAEELQKIKNFEFIKPDDFDQQGSDVREVYQLVKKHKSLENSFRRDYRVSTKRLNYLRQVMSQYLGAHNFHNFTLGKDFKDPSAIRYMKNIKVSDPFVINNTEWVSIKIHGQSFMLHQIRKMISMATFIVRCGASKTLIHEAFKADKLNIPKAPALGLLLENPVYSTFNERLNSLGYESIDFTHFEKQMTDFKMRHIYDKIYAEEVKENVFYAFFGFVDALNKVVDSKSHENSDKTSCFQYFVTAKKRSEDAEDDVIYTDVKQLKKEDAATGAKTSRKSAD